jgi:hypothetical protein
MRVVAIQNGPYKSGLLLMTCLNEGLRVTADTILSLIYYYSISKYFLTHSKKYLMLRQKKKSAGLSYCKLSPGRISASSFSKSRLNKLIGFMDYNYINLNYDNMLPSFISILP